MRPVYKALGKNEIVVIAFDGRDGSNWIEVDFFSKKALFSTGPFDLARRTSAAIIPTFIIRKETHVHRLILEPAFELSNDENTQSALRKDTENYSALFSKYVAKYPCHFAMVLCKMQERTMIGASKPFYLES